LLVYAYVGVALNTPIKISDAAVDKSGTSCSLKICHSLDKFGLDQTSNLLKALFMKKEMILQLVKHLKDFDKAFAPSYLFLFLLFFIIYI